ncbi:hypothetical protein, partial [Tenacibaculum maritimum]
MRILQHNERKQKLIELGIPKELATNLEDIESHWMILNPDESYDILKSIHKSNEVLKNYNLVPIYERMDDVYQFVIIYAFNSEEKRIIHYEFNGHAEDRGYNNNFQLLLLEELIEYYFFVKDFIEEERDEELSKHELLKEEKNDFLCLAELLGFVNSNKMLNLLQVTNHIESISYNSLKDLL